MFGSYVESRIFVMQGRACRGAGNPVEKAAGARGASRNEEKLKDPSRPEGQIVPNRGAKGRVKPVLTNVIIVRT